MSAQSPKGKVGRVTVVVVVVVVGSVVVVVGGSVPVVVVVVGGGGATVVVVLGGGLEGEVVDVGLTDAGPELDLLAEALAAVDLAFAVPTDALPPLEFEVGRVVSGSETGFDPRVGVVDALGRGELPVGKVMGEVDRAPVVDVAATAWSARTADWVDWGPEASTPNRMSVPPATIRASAMKDLRRWVTTV
jgi:hypothetical protein